jgi:hypothetical protein
MQQLGNLRYMRLGVIASPMPPRTKQLQGECQHCGGSLEFPAESIGLMAPCPRCGEQTELMLTRPPDEPMIPRKVIVWTAITIALLIAGLIAVLVELKRVERRAAAQRQRLPAAAQVATNTPAQPPPNSEPH